jgi:Uma2 family endonuclease
MAAAPAFLTLDEYQRQYANKHGCEYWFGEVVRKGVPTWLHSLLQVLLGDVFYRLGYISGSEIELRIDPNWEPRPDVAATLHIEHPYPTKPVDIVAEILSPDDSMSQLFKKCRQYVRIGIPQIFVFDPEAQDAWEWSTEADNLDRIHTLKLGNGSTLEVNTIWEELDRRAQNRR